MSLQFSFIRQYNVKTKGCKTKSMAQRQKWYWLKNHIRLLILLDNFFLELNLNQLLWDVTLRSAPSILSGRIWPLHFYDCQHKKVFCEEVIFLYLGSETRRNPAKDLRGKVASPALLGRRNKTLKDAGPINYPNFLNCHNIAGKRNLETKSRRYFDISCCVSSVASGWIWGRVAR